MDNQKNSPYKRQRQDKQSVLIDIRNQVQKGTSLSLYELKSKYNEEQLFQIGLKHVTTTKKAYCEALYIPVEAGCRYKRKLELYGLLKQSIDDVVCPYTKDFARLISTNPDEYERLTKTDQYSLF
jgi:hypothetical protein